MHLKLPSFIFRWYEHVGTQPLRGQRVWKVKIFLFALDSFLHYLPFPYLSHSLMALLPASSVPKRVDAEGAMQPCGHQSSDCTCQHGSAGSSMWLSADWNLFQEPCGLWNGAVAGAVPMPGIDGSRKPDSQLGGACVSFWAWIHNNLILNQHKSKWILCVQCPEFWKSQPLTLLGVCVCSPKWGSALGQLTGFTELETWPSVTLFGPCNCLASLPF